MWYIRLLQTNRVPDPVIRLGIRAYLMIGLAARYRKPPAQRKAEKRALIAKLRASPIAIHTDDPNRQHYEVPTEFFQLVLGKHLKYSCCYWPEGVNDLNAAEAAMLHLTCQRARLKDGMSVLDLGCGWGSLAFWIAQNYPNCQVTAVSNSQTQIAYIQRIAAERGLANIRAAAVNIEDFNPQTRFDRVLSIEMFEHMKNYGRLLEKISRMLRPEGKLFVHIFSHREFAYEFDAENPNDWMAQTFFTGGTMPSQDLLLHFQDDLHLVEHWHLNGSHYAQTLRAWLDQLDRQMPAVREILRETYGPAAETRWLVNWRLFFMGCEETFGVRGGTEYQVSQYLFENTGGVE